MPCQCGEVYFFVEMTVTIAVLRRLSVMAGHQDLSSSIRQFKEFYMNANTPKNANLSLAFGAALTAGLALSPSMVQADSNPFVTTELNSGYVQLAEGKCGEGKCGAADGKDAEGKCGAGDKDTEGKCGEGKCGGSN